MVIQGEKYTEDGDAGRRERQAARASGQRERTQKDRYVPMVGMVVTISPSLSL